MSQKLKDQYYVLREGALQEEACEWHDLEAMCKAGGLSADAKVFLPEEDCWKRVVDTDLAPLLEAVDQENTDDADGEEGDRNEEYQRLLNQLQDEPGDLGLLLEGAALALGLKDVDAAKSHYQEALEFNPYHPRVVQEIKQNLHPSNWKSFRFFVKAAPFWEEIGKVFAYPLSRGALYVVVPAVLLSPLAFIPYGHFLAAAVLYLLCTQVVRSSARGEGMMPAWDSILPFRSPAVLVKPLLSGLLVAASLYLPFVLIAEGAILAGASEHNDPLLFIAKSPWMVVVVFVISLFYLPGALVLMGRSDYKVLHVANPRRVAMAIVLMEHEYILALSLAFLLIAAWRAVTVMSGVVPFAGEVVSMVAATYVVTVVGFVLGQLYSRFREQMQT